MPTLGILIASTRAGRIGTPVAEWFTTIARQHGAFTIESLDLKTVPLPMLEEAHHPRLGRYEHQTTKDWSARIAPIDAFVIVTPEYNHGPAPALVNALAHLYHEWNYKPVGFVSYGGISGGTRAALMTKPMLAALKMVPIVEAVPIPFVSQHVESGIYNGDSHEKAAVAMLDELVRWTSALSVLRAKT